MAKKQYPLTKALLFRNKKMEITFNEQELSKVIEAGLAAVGYNAGTIESMNVTQSRKTGNASLTLEVNPFGLAVSTVEPVEHVQEEEVVEEVITPEPEVAAVVEEVTPEVVEEPTIVEETESTLVSSEAVEPEVVEEEEDNLFATPEVVTEKEPEVAANPDSLFG